MQLKLSKSNGPADVLTRTYLEWYVPHHRIKLGGGSYLRYLDSQSTF